MQIPIPERIRLAAEKAGRVLCLYGGRGSAKSESVARLLLYEGGKSRKRFLCCREFQNSIADSVHSLLSDIILEYNMSDYTVTEKYITHKNGTEFLFKGLKKESLGSIKSLNKISACWVEEAQYISRKSLDILTPTIREPNSKILFTMNPENEDDPVYVDYILAERDDTVKCLVNWTDNPWFPKVLRDQMEYDKKVDYDKYLHIWEGHCVKHSEAQVFYGKWKVEDFETPEGTIFYHGADWGFSVDPTAAIRCYISDGNLFVDYDAWGIGIDIDKTGELFQRIPCIQRHRIIADSARPETINYLARQGFNITGAKKGKGSVEDGIEFIRSFEQIIIHPRCQHTIDEFRNYCWKVDQKTGTISTVPEDKHNHLIDALRYALEDVMRNNYATVVRY